MDAKQGGLVLTRKPGQKIITDGPTEMEVVWASHGRVKLRYVADKSVRIVRAELETKGEKE